MLPATATNNSAFAIAKVAPQLSGRARDDAVNPRDQRQHEDPGVGPGKQQLTNQPGTSQSTTNRQSGNGRRYQDGYGRP